MKRLRKAFVALSVGWLAQSFVGCGELPAIAADVCGNGVHEAGEACDGPQPAGQACAANCQAFLCSASPAGPRCPNGRVCGLDGTCYAAGGALLPSTVTLRGAADHFASVQLSTGLPRSLVAQTGDVLGRGKPRFVTFAGDGAVLEDNTLLTSIGALGSIDLENDGREELYGALPGGTVVLDAPGDGSISPRSFATFSALPGTTRVAPVKRPSETYDDGLLLSTETPPDGSRQIVGFAQDASLAAPVVRFPGAAEDILGTASLADVKAEQADGCSPLLLAMNGQLDVLRIDPCTRTPTGVQMAQSDEPNGIPARRAMPIVRSALPIVGGPFVTFVDGDDYADIVLLVAVSNKDMVAAGDMTGDVGFAIAFGGVDGFGSRPAGPARVLGLAERVALLTRRTSGQNAQLGRPLEVTAFPRPRVASETLDAASSWAFQEGNERGLVAAFQRGVGIGRWAEPTVGGGQTIGALSFTIGYTRLSAWTAVAIGSINGDDLPDVVGGSDTESDLDVLTSSESLLFSAGAVATNATTERLAIADFDGDLVNDIAFSTSGVDTAGVTNATLSVVYGRSLALPDPLVVVGRYPGATIAQVIGEQFGFQDASVDFSSELAVVLRGANAAKETVSVLRGDGNRLPLAPLALTAPRGISADTLTSVPLRTGATTPARFMMIGDGRTDGIDIWQETAIGQTAVRGGPLTGCIVAGVQADPRFRRADAVAIDLDGDGVDEAVVAAECPTGADNAANTTYLFVLAAGEGGMAVRDGGSTLAVRRPDDPNARVGQATLSAGDVDGDGIPDVLVQLEGVGPQRRADTRTWVYWGTRTTLSPTPLELRVGDSPVVATTFLGLETGARPRLVAASRAGLFVARAGVAAQTLTFDPLPFADASSASTLDDDLRAVFGGDFTGDHVDDLVVADADTFRLFRGASLR